MTKKNQIKTVSDALAVLDQVIQENYDYVTLMNSQLEELREAIGRKGGLKK
jgi:predicted rRNA methylase YqxC with S4 and FtsJ domains